MLNEDRVRQLSAETEFAKGGTGLQAPQRERGLWSFLTWSFFLSQLAVGNAFTAGAAQAGSGVDLKEGGDASNAAKSSSALGTPDLRAISMVEPQFAAPPVAAQPTSGEVVASAKPAGVEQIDLTSEAGLGIQAAIAQSSAAAEGAQSIAGENGGALAPEVPPELIPGVELPPTIDLPPILGGVLPPALEMVDDLVDGLGPTLDGLLVPVVQTVDDLASVLAPTLDHVLAPVETLVDGVVGGLQPTLDPLLAPVAGVSEGLGELLEPIGGVAGEIMVIADPIIDIAEPILSPVMNLVGAAEPILDPALDVAAPVFNLIEPVVEPLLQPLAPVTEPLLEMLPLNVGNGGLLSGLFGSNGGSDAIASSGSLEFAAQAEVTSHDLFQAGMYTEFGIALHETPAGSETENSDPLANVGDTIGSLLGDDADQGLPSLIGNLQHEVSLRGLGEGLI
jgi:hypothetical protein